MRDHDLRQLLNDELHGRPGQSVAAPARITHIAFTLEPGDGDPQPLIGKLCDAMGARLPAENALHHAVELAGGHFKYERHGEFYRIAITVPDKGAHREAVDALPPGWLDELPGRRLVGIHTRVLEQAAPPPGAATLRDLFGTDELAGSKVSQGGATVWTDFRIAADGYTHMLVHDHGLSPLRMGRVCRRIHEIETYRMMALLAFPLARRVQKELQSAEQRLSQTINAMTAPDGIEDDARLLAELTAIARDVEGISNRTSYRFAASRAYAALVDKRVRELGEERVESFQRLGVFLDRRFSPAMNTCQAVADRITSLALRSERASNLLRTRVDIALEGQNQDLLRSMESRARQQLMLQETVEGLSVVAISYYLLSVVGKFIDGIGDFLPWLNVKLTEWLAIPVVLVVVFLSLRHLRHRLHRALEGE
jgi:uncharacterized membrane-anchored protein